MIDQLKEIVEHNEKELTKVGGEQNLAENLFTIGHNEMSIYHFFYDETLREEVDPIEYYGRDKLLRVIEEFEASRA